MKKLLFISLLLFVVCGTSSAAIPTINPIQPTYRNDNSMVLMNDIEPNREFLMTYQIIIDSGGFYEFFFRSNFREFATPPQKLSSGAAVIELKFPLELRSEESAKFTIRVSTNNEESREHTINLAAARGESRVKIIPSFIELKTGDSMTVVAQGRAKESDEYSTFNLLTLMMIEGLKCEYSIDDQKIATFSSDDGLYAHIRGLAEGTTTLRLKFFTEKEGYPTGDTAECLIRVGVDQSTPTPTPPDSDQPSTPQVPGTNKENNNGGGGCNAGFIGLLALAMVPVVRKKRR